MSLVPRKLAPSAITMRGARMLPVSRPVDSSTTRSVAWQSPTTSPATTTVCAETSALTVPPGAIRSSAVSRTVPSIVPSTSTGSAPWSSPFSWTFVPITQGELRCAGVAGAGAGLAETGALCPGAALIVRGIGSGGRLSFFPKIPMAPPGDPSPTDVRAGRAAGAGDGIRTRDSELGKLVLYQLSYARLVRSTGHDRHRPAGRSSTLRSGSAPDELQHLVAAPLH